MESWENIILYFAICSFLGPLIWRIFEKLSLVPKQKKLLYGPFSIIDGISVILVYFSSLLPIPLMIKIISYLIIIILLEYSSIILYGKVFQGKRKLEKINFKIIFLWFGLILFVVLIGQQTLFGLLGKIPKNISVILSLVFLTYLAIDFIFSIRKLKDKWFNS